MKLIIDSGSTKAHWVFLEGEDIIYNIETEGFNPYYATEKQIKNIIVSQLSKDLFNYTINEIHFYGTGCSSEKNCNIIQSILKHYFRAGYISVNHDLYAAAVSLLGRDRGIACILGTGSNSCLWDGKKIVNNIPSLGYLLGDEGSATYLGKMLLRKVLRNELDKKLTKDCHDSIKMNIHEIQERIYNYDDGNRWLAGLSVFISENILHPEMEKIVLQNFEDFVKNQLSKYMGYQNEKISFVGSISWFFKPQLLKVMEHYHLNTGVIYRSPMEGLIQYHQKNNR